MGIAKEFRRPISNLSPYQRLRAKLAYQRAVEYGDPDPIGFVAQLYRESQFDPNAHSGAGAHGEGQFMPATAARFGLNTSDPDASQMAALKYRKAIRAYLGKRGVTGENYTLAGYNAGEGNAVKALTKFRETIGYVQAINQSRSEFARLLGTDPSSVPEPAATVQPYPPAYTPQTVHAPAKLPSVAHPMEATLNYQPEATAFMQSTTPVKDYTDSLWKQLLGR